MPFAAVTGKPQPDRILRCPQLISTGRCRAFQPDGAGQLPCPFPVLRKTLHYRQSVSCGLLPAVQRFSYSPVYCSHFPCPDHRSRSGYPRANEILIASGSPAVSDSTAVPSATALTAVCAGQMHHHALSAIKCSVTSRYAPLLPSTTLPFSYVNVTASSVVTG